MVLCPSATCIHEWRTQQQQVEEKCAVRATGRVSDGRQITHNGTYRLADYFHAVHPVLPLEHRCTESCVAVHPDRSGAAAH